MRSSWRFEKKKKLLADRARRATVLRDRGLLPESSRTRGARWATVLRRSRAPAAEKLEVEVASPSCKRVASKSAGYDCVINATVREGRVWLPKQHHRLDVAQKPWGGHPSCDAGPLTTSLRGLWVSDLLPPGNGGTNEGAATQKPTVRHNGAATPKPTSERRNSRSNLGARERDPRTLASWRHCFSASCRGNCLRYGDKFQAVALRNGMSLVGFRNWTIGQWYELISSCPLYVCGFAGTGTRFPGVRLLTLPVSTQTPLASSDVEGRWQWPSLVAILCTAAACAVGLT